MKNKQKKNNEITKKKCITSIKVLYKAIVIKFLVYL